MKLEQFFTRLVKHCADFARLLARHDQILFGYLQNERRILLLVLVYDLQLGNFVGGLIRIGRALGRIRLDRHETRRHLAGLQQLLGNSRLLDFSAWCVLHTRVQCEGLLLNNQLSSLDLRQASLSLT